MMMMKLNFSLFCRTSFAELGLHLIMHPGLENGFEKNLGFLGLKNIKTYNLFLKKPRFFQP